MIRVNFTPAEVVTKLKELPLATAPGEKYAYTTANYAVLALIIERVTGESFARVAKRMIYDPAKMTDSGDLTTTTVVPRLASGYMPDPFGRGLSVCGPEDTSWKASGGSGYATARDLHRFHRAFFAGRLLPEALKPSDVIKTTSFLERPAVRSSGSFPGANANATYFPEEQISVVVLSNNYAPVTATIAEGIAKLHFGMPAPVPVAPTIRKGIKAHPTMAGKWTIEGAPWSFTLAMRDDVPVLVWSEIRQGALLPLGDGAWFTPFDWATLTFTHDADGNVTGGSMTAAWLDKPAKLIKAP
jgi:CubicO group peptidase (beta-lactamase class C family)